MANEIGYPCTDVPSRVCQTAPQVVAHGLPVVAAFRARACADPVADLGFDDVTSVRLGSRVCVDRIEDALEDRLPVAEELAVYRHRSAAAESNQSERSEHSNKPEQQDSCNQHPLGPAFAPHKRIACTKSIRKLLETLH